MIDSRFLVRGFLVAGLTACGTSSAPGPAAAPTAGVAFDRPEESLRIDRPALYPETIVYDAPRSRFLVGSFREGAIYAIDGKGSTTPFVTDARLCSVLGIAIDVERNRLWAVNADMGSSLKPSSAGAKKLATVGVYDLTTAAPVAYVDLANVAPGNHLLNGIALDRNGNAYVTDSFSPNIYRVDTSGHASLFLRDERFAGEGVNLNGLVVHPDGYLLVVKKSDGTLFKVPLDEPRRFSEVTLPKRIVGADGVLLSNANQLVVVANKVPGAAANAAFALATSDAWKTANVVAEYSLGDVYPTTAVVRDEKVYVLYSKLNELLQAPADQKAAQQEVATIRRIGSITR